MFAKLITRKPATQSDSMPRGTMVRGVGMIAADYKSDFQEPTPMQSAGSKAVMAYRVKARLGRYAGLPERV